MISVKGGVPGRNKRLNIVINFYFLDPKKHFSHGILQKISLWSTTSNMIHVIYYIINDLV